LAGNEQKSAVYHCFDMMPLPAWTSQKSAVYAVRRVDLMRLSSGSAWEHFDNLERVKAFPLDIVAAIAHGMDYFDALRDRQIKDGEEGLIIRLNTPYNFKTRSSMMKHKKMDTMDCVIQQVLPGEDGKKFANTAGRILVTLDDGETLCYAGIKASDQERAELWKRRNLLAGQVCEVSYQSMTRSKTGAPKLQFPVFLRVREDKS
jgi:ATP-dependent DNA ligase